MSVTLEIENGGDKIASVVQRQPIASFMGATKKQISLVGFGLIVAVLTTAKFTSLSEMIYPITSTINEAPIYYATDTDLDIEECRKYLSPPSTKTWLSLRDFQHVLDQVSAPAFLFGGTVLGLTRHCDPNPRGRNRESDDVDFAVEHRWYIENFNTLSRALAAAGFKPKWYFPGGGSFRSGSGPPVHIIKAVGFEAAWTKRGIKVDLFSVTFEKDKIIGALWTGGGKKYNQCVWKSTSQVSFKWYDINVRVPKPLNVFLTSWYGKDYIRPQPWVWNVGPFKTGACTDGTKITSVTASPHSSLSDSLPPPPPPPPLLPDDADADDNDDVVVLSPSPSLTDSSPSPSSIIPGELYVKECRKYLSPPSTKTWLSLRDFQHVLDQVSAPAFLFGGTVLGLTRHCDPNPRGRNRESDDVDFAVEHRWYIENFNTLSRALAAAGFKPKWYFPGQCAAWKLPLPL